MTNYYYQFSILQRLENVYYRVFKKDTQQIHKINDRNFINLTNAKLKELKNKNVKIILSADNQKLSMFSPSFSSTPAKSEAEIMALLGQIVISEETDSIRDFGINVLAGGLNYVAQATAVKELEDELYKAG